MKHTKPANAQTKTLLTQGSVLLRHFNDAGRPAFTLQEAAEVLKNSTRDATKKLLSGMVKRGLLLRLKEGVYWIIPYDQDPNTYFPNTHLVVKYLTGNAGYYIGYYSALELHSLITQPSFREQIVVNRQIKPSS
ncbi:MAG: type IV toxin-antitoxin system AbiEi family antitoxin domain-containing protein, partial [Bacteroidota bacterium]